MKRVFLTILLAAAALGANAQGALQQKVENIVKGSSVLRGAGVAVSVVDSQGKALVRYNDAQRLVPASNMKLITTGTALHSLGADYTFKTAIGYTGTIQDGTLKGDVYIMGGGDPTLGAQEKDYGRLPFSQWQGILLKAGIKNIDGRIIGDSRLWEGYLEFGDWTYEDVGTYYGTGSAALCFYKNAIDLQVAAAGPGEPVKAVQAYPETPWMHNANTAFTGPEGTGNSLYLYTTDLAPYAELRGTFAVDRAPKTEHFANKFGALTCAYYFCRHLQSQGVTVTGGAADIDRSGRIRTMDFVPREPAGEPEVIGHTTSAPLKDIVRKTNLDSDNFYAEAMYRTMAEETSGIAVYDSARVAECAVLRKLGLDPGLVSIVDGSGLSRRNGLSASFLTKYLYTMTSSPAFPAFLESLPMPGEGTLDVLFRDKPQMRSYRLKSGSMEGVLCYSGYILDDGGTPLASVSVLVNGATAKMAQVRKAIEAILGEILLYLQTI